MNGEQNREDYDKIMKVVKKIEIATGISRKRLLHLVRIMSNDFGVKGPVIPESNKTLEDELNFMFPEHDMATTYETPKEKRDRQKKEYREYLNRVHK
jgi:hypothetical protein